jgi:WD40 repeat protein
MLTGCEDHSLRVWDYKTYKPEAILSGHRDVVTGGVFLNANTYVTSSWDMTVKMWKV